MYLKKLEGEGHMSPSLKKFFLQNSSLFCWIVMSSFSPSSNEGRKGRGRRWRKWWLALAMWKSGWCDTLVVINLLRCIRCHDRVSPPRVTSGGSGSDRKWYLF